MSRKTDHYFTTEPQTPHSLHTIEVELRGITLTFLTDAGVFSRTRIDRGTRLLIESARLPRSGSVLDLGCGYGPIGLAFAKMRSDLDVILVDINRRATDLARRNAEENGLANVRVYEGDGFAVFNADRRFSAVVTNPPFRAGKAKVYGLVEDAAARLVPGGALTCVARTKQGAKSLKSHIETLFGNVHELGKAGGYRVFEAVSRTS